MRVLVTGHRGYIGAELVPALRTAGHEVLGLDAGWYEGCDFGSTPDDVPTLDADLRDVTEEDCRGLDAVVHLAALSNDALGNLDPALTEDVNFRGSVHLARVAKAAGVRRFVFSSSCSLYGGGGQDLLDERSPFAPVTPYGETKIRVEHALAHLAEAGRFSPVSLRNATAYGVSRRLRADIVVNDLVGQAVTTGRIRLQSDGSPWRPLVHVGDIALAVTCCLAAPVEAIHAEAFNVGRSGENFRVREIAAQVAAAVPGTEITLAPGAGPDARNYRVDFRKIEAHLPGYRPRSNLHAGIEEMRDAFRRHGLTREDWEGPRYFRLRTIRARLDRGELDGSLRRA